MPDRQPNKEALSEQETQTLVSLLGKVKLPAPYLIFKALCKSVPLVAINIALMPDDDHILLTYRKDEFYDHWHIPGSILLTGEHPEKEAIPRVGKKELGIEIKNFQFMYYFNEFCLREHGIALLFKVNAHQYAPNDGTYFHLDELPTRFLEEQRQEIEFLKSLRKNH